MDADDLFNRAATSHGTASRGANDQGGSCGASGSLNTGVAASSSSAGTASRRRRGKGGGGVAGQMLFDSDCCAGSQCNPGKCKS
jgi:hypothetical protein